MRAQKPALQWKRRLLNALNQAHSTPLERKKYN